MYDDLTAYIRFGDKGSGKSLLGAVMCSEFLDEYEHNAQKYNLPERILFTSEKLNEEIEAKHLGKRLFYWSDPKQLKFCPRPNCWKKVSDFKLGVDYEHQNNPEGKHPCHDLDIYWSEVGRHMGADKSKETPYWLKDLFAFIRKDRNRIFMDAQVFEDISIAIRRQIGHAYLCVKNYGSADLRADKPAPVPWTLKNVFDFKKRVVWGRISEYEFDPKFLEWERNPEARMMIQEENKKSRRLYLRWRYISLYDTAHRIPPYRAGLEHVEFWCENPDCTLHGRKFGKPKVEHFKI